MKYDWLLDLVALLDTGSVTDAANARHISQSAFSRRVQMLESVLGLELMDRTSKPNSPTQALLDYADEIRKLVYLQNSLIRQLQMEGRTESKLIVIASQHAITTSLGHSIVKKVSEIGKTHVRLRSANLDECEALLLTGQADFALNYMTERSTGKSQNSLTRDVPIAEDTLVPVFASNEVNRLLWQFHKGQLDIVAYPSDVFLGMELDHQIFPSLEGKCRINTIAETALSPAALQLAAAAVGIAWVPKALAQHRLKDGSVTDLSDHFGSLEMKIVARRLLDKGSKAKADAWERLIYMSA